MNIEKFCPIWPTCDLDAAEAFYRKLGFGTAYKDHAYGYLILKRDMAELHFFHDQTHVPVSSKHGGYMRPRDVDGLSEEWERVGLPTEGIPRMVKAEDKPWGMRELILVDEDGHLIRAGLEIEDWDGGNDAD